MHTIASILHYYGVLSLWSAAKHSQRRSGNAALQIGLLVATNSTGHAVFAFTQDHTQGFEKSQVSFRDIGIFCCCFDINDFLCSILISTNEIVKISDFGTSREWNEISTKMSFAGTVVADNPAFRRMMNQLKLSEPVSNSGTGSEEE